MPRPVAIGAKRHQIQLQVRNPEIGGFGNTSTAFADSGDPFFAEAITAGGREFLLAQQVRPELSVRFKARAGPVVAAEDRIVFNGRKLNVIAAYDPEERGRELCIDCSEYVGGDDA